MFLRLTPQRLHKTIRQLFGKRIVLNLDSDMLNALTALADEKQRSIETIASELLSAVIAQQEEGGAYAKRWEGLSPRERQVAALICLNYTNREIARRLIISPETVKTHVRNILGKTGTRSKTALRQALENWDYQDWL